MIELHSKESISRLRILATFLGTVQEDKFNMNAWVTTYAYGALAYVTPEEQLKELSCGTSACALGYAAIIPEFKELGLKLYEDRWGLSVAFNDSKDSFDAGSKFFGITIDEADSLFYTDEYMADYESEWDFDASEIPKQMVINRINNLADQIENELNATA